MVSAGDDLESGFFSTATATATTSSSASRDARQKRVTHLALTCAFVVCTTLLVFVISTKAVDSSSSSPIALATSTKVAAHIAKAAKSAAAVTANAKPAANLHRPSSTEERIEAVLRKNLDRTADSMAQKQLQPLLISQGRQVLHSAKNKIQTYERHLKPGGDGMKDTDGTQGDLHSALLKEDSQSHTDPTTGKPFHHNSMSEEDRTESALRHQLDMETSQKEKQMFKDSLDKVHAQLEGSSKDNTLGHSLEEEHKHSQIQDSGVSESQRNEEAALKAQLEARVKAKQKSMYHAAFKDWLEKQQSIKYKRVKKQVTIASQEDALFKKTLQKAKEEGPELEKRLKKQEQMMEGGIKKSHKPSFSTWLKAFKQQLVHRTKEASKKIAEARYTTAKAKGKTGVKVTHEPPVVTLQEAAEKRARAEKAVLELQKSLKLEQVEEKAVAQAEDKETTPGKALAMLKKTMAKERKALREISEDEKGVGADPNLAALTPKAPKPKVHDSGILGLDDLNYY